MEEYKLVEKYINKKKKIKKEENQNKKILYSFLNRTLLSFLLLAVVLCITKIDNKSKQFIEQEVYNKNISFAQINEMYKKVFGSTNPISKYIVEKTNTVFNETLSYSKKESYKEGVKLTVSKNYLVPILESGIVVYKGDKDNYGNTIIIQQINGVDLWYVGVDNSNLKLYDYVEKGSLLGEATSGEFYLYYQKDGKFIDYQEYLG